MSITVIGNASIEFSASVNRLPAKGESIAAASFKQRAGGKGFIEAIAAARLGREVAMFTRVGEDNFGNTLLQTLMGENVRVVNIPRSETPTGSSLITTDAAGQSTIVVFPGANSELNEQVVMQHIERIINSDILLLQQETPAQTVGFAVETAAQHKPLIIVNPSPALTLPHELYKHIDCLTPNVSELSALTHKDDLQEGVEVLLSWGVKNVIVTLSDKGCYYANAEEQYFVEPFKVDAIDKAGVGDAFNAALAVALSEGRSYREAMIFANAVGALTASKPGSIESLPMRSEVEYFIREY